jgi:glyoxylase-like metal-dependent hydrolase (beta-lactamase superfamily II)
VAAGHHFGIAGSEARYPAGRTQIAAGISAWLTPNGGWGESNAALISGHGESLLVDTLWDLPRTAAMLEGFRPQIESAPIRRLVNTHADGDHWFGNQLVGAPQIVATKAAARAMQRHGPGEMKALAVAGRVFGAIGYAPVPRRSTFTTTACYLDTMTRGFDFANIRRSLPNQTFSEKLALEVGGRQVRLIEVGPAHTSGDLVVYLPDDRVLIAGDILFLGSTPVLWEGSSRNWIRACERILRWQVDAVLPGHGPLTDLSGIDAVRRYWVFLRSAAKRQYEHGHSPFQAALRIARSDEFQRQPFAAWDVRERIAINVHMIYRRLMKRSRHIGPLERLMLLRRTALLAEKLA